LKLPEHIFLTGFMGSGKTTLGKKLASLMNLPFIDLDRYIETKEKDTIANLFENKGETVFREIESACLDEILQQKQSTVISLGGGTICFHSNLEKVKNKGTLVYIDLPPKVLVERIKNGKTKRPLLKNVAEQDMFDFVEQKLEERKNYYNKAHIIVNGLNLTPQHLHQIIIGSLQKNIS
jgi:shikimate kinase